MIRSFRSKALERLWTRNDTSGSRPDWIGKVRRHLSRLDASVRPDDMNTPGSRYHVLSGDRLGRYALTVSRNWRMTFSWIGEDSVDVDLEDYHG